MRTLIPRLPERQREALRLRRFEEWTYEQIADAMGGTPTGARANVYQAIRGLRKMWDLEDSE